MILERPCVFTLSVFVLGVSSLLQGVFIFLATLCVVACLWFASLFIFTSGALVRVCVFYIPPSLDLASMPTYWWTHEEPTKYSKVSSINSFYGRLVYRAHALVADVAVG